MSARAVEKIANLAKRRPLRGIQLVCETQHQISTRKLERYLDLAGDELAGYAFDLRIEFDKITGERDALRAQVGAMRGALERARGVVAFHHVTAGDRFREIELAAIDAALQVEP